MPSDHLELEAGTSGRRRRRLHPLAGMSLLLGLMSLFVVAAAGAVVIGLIARRSIRRSEGRSWGSILAFLGVGLGCVGLAIQGISAYQAVALYREVTPVAEQLLTLVGDKQWYQTYELFSPSYRKEVPLGGPGAVLHEQAMRGIFPRADRFVGLGWAFRFPPPNEGQMGGDEVRITYDVRFSSGRGRFTFHFVKTQGGWLIDRILPE